MLKSSATDSGSFALTVQFEKREIHKVFLRFPNFHLEQNLALTDLADFTLASSTSLMNLEEGIGPKAEDSLENTFSCVPKVQGESRISQANGRRSL